MVDHLLPNCVKEEIELPQHSFPCHSIELGSYFLKVVDEWRDDYSDSRNIYVNNSEQHVNIIQSPLLANEAKTIDNSTSMSDHKITGPSSANSDAEDYANDNIIISESTTTCSTQLETLKTNKTASASPKAPANRRRAATLDISTTNKVSTSKQKEKSARRRAKTTETQQSKSDENAKSQELYKTEMCRSFEETGKCKYGNKCHFAHSQDEMRQVKRHPRYKTEVCRTYSETGSCPYGKRYDTILF